MNTRKRKKRASDFLGQELQLRRTRNPRYSLRAFSKALGVSPGTICDVLQGNRRISPALGEKLSQAFKANPRMESDFLATVQEENELEETKQRLAGLKRRIETYSEWTPTDFAKISDWYHLAILSLMETKGFRSNSTWIARRLGLEKSLVDRALLRLQEVGAVKRHGRRLVACNGWTTTTTDIPDSFLRRAHQQAILQSLEALEKQPVARRDITGITMAIDPTKLADAKELIRCFRRQIAKLLETGTRTEVYNLNIQLVPLT